MARTANPHWIEPHPHGIFVRPAGVWIDPARPADVAFVTHGHADHARSGHARVHATPETLAIMALRYGVTEGQGAAQTDFKQSKEAVFAGKASMGVKVTQPIRQPFSDLQGLLSCTSRPIYYR